MVFIRGLGSEETIDKFRKSDKNDTRTKIVKSSLRTQRER